MAAAVGRVLPSVDSIYLDNGIWDFTGFQRLIEALPVGFNGHPGSIRCAEHRTGNLIFRESVDNRLDLGRNGDSAILARFRFGTADESSVCSVIAADIQLKKLRGAETKIAFCNNIIGIGDFSDFPGQRLQGIQRKTFLADAGFTIDNQVLTHIQNSQVSGDRVLIKQAEHLRPIVEKAMQSLPDSEALQAKTLYPIWEELVNLGRVNTGGEPGYRFYYDGNLFRCIYGDPEFRQEWQPGIYTSALYVRIDETHAGTLDDPIPAARGMEYTYGLYYYDPEVEKTYKCQRTGEADGGKVQLAYLPHELVGHYFVEA